MLWTPRVRNQATSPNGVSAPGMRICVFWVVSEVRRRPPLLHGSNNYCTLVPLKPFARHECRCVSINKRCINRRKRKR